MTENKTAEIETGRTTERYDLLLKATGDAVWELDLATGETYISGQGFKFLFGYNIINEFIDDQFWESRLHPDEKQKIFNEFDIILNNENIEQHTFEYRFLKANSSYAWVKDRFFIVRENGHAVRLIGAMQDISLQKEEARHLKLLESAIASAIDPVLILESPETSPENITITHVNAAFMTMSGYTREEIIGKTPALFNGPGTNMSRIKELAEAARKRKTCKVEMINYKKNGNAHWVEIALAPVTTDQGNGSHFIVTIRDIGCHKIQEEEQEKLIQELTQNNIDLRQFSYITSHNLRGPIASLLGLCTLLEHFKIEDPTLKQILDGVKKATHMFDGTIKDLTTVLNVRDRTSIPKQDIIFSDVYEKALAQSEVLIEYSGAQINADFKCAPTVNYNKAYLESIFSNLITNAIKYRSPARPLEILITTEISENFVTMTFGDNGLGIDLDLHKEKMFRLYQRFHDHAEGKGLGLFLIKSQLEALNGNIDIESKVGEGTKFILKFKR